MQMSVIPRSPGKQLFESALSTKNAKDVKIALFKGRTMDTSITASNMMTKGKFD
jgi:hypothetical protein